MKTFNILLFVCFSILLFSCRKENTDDLPVDQKVSDLLSRMTLEEKVGQMIQEETRYTEGEYVTEYFFGSILSGGGSAPRVNSFAGWADMIDYFQSYALETRLKIPIIYGADAVHGHNNVYGAVIFPHNIGMGCMRNPELIEEAASATAEEMMASGVRWNFAPCVAVARNIRWGRTYESYSEDPALVSECGVAAIKGYQGSGLSGSSILACAKHYLGDGGTTGGVDQGNTEADEETLRSLYLPMYREAINAGVGSVMVSFSSWNGVKMHANKYLITDVLKSELGFKGIVVSDWMGINQINPDFKTSIETAINAGIDMAMIPGSGRLFASHLISLVNEGKVPVSRIDDAVTRILTVKFKMNVFDDSYTNRSLTGSINFDEHRQIARECVRRSLVLLKNDYQRLPLSKSLTRIHVAGFNSHNIGAQCGGWTISWMGQNGDITPGTSILDGIRAAVSSGTEVTWSVDGSGAAGADIGIVVAGESPYAEMMGDRSDLPLPDRDIIAMNNMKDAGIPVVLIIISGRPMIITDVINDCDAVIAAWLPGTEGQGIADVLFGDFNPSGKLSHTWPKNISQEPINIGDEDYDPLFPFGFGLTY